MKKLLLLSALMLTTNAMAAASVDPCDDLQGSWFGEQTSFSGKQAVNARISSQGQAVYLEVDANLSKGECISPPSNRACFYTETLRLFGTCISGILDFTSTTQAGIYSSIMGTAGAIYFNANYEINNFKGTIGNEKKITLNGDLSPKWGGTLHYTLYKKD